VEEWNVGKMEYWNIGIVEGWDEKAKKVGGWLTTGFWLLSSAGL